MRWHILAAIAASATAVAATATAAPVAEVARAPIDPWSVATAVGTIIVAWFTGWVALSTQALAKATSALSNETRDLAKETVRASRMAEQHHQEQFAPLVFPRLNLRVTGIALEENEGHGRAQLYFSGVVQNAGNGTAVNIEMTVTLIGFEPVVLRLGMLQGNKSAPFSKSLTAGVFELGDFESRLLPYSIVTSYTTFFDAKGTTAQHTNSGEAVDLITTRCGFPAYVDRNGLP